jgi:hypothetical protein
MVPAIVIIINGYCIAKTNSDPDGSKITWGPELSFRIAKFTGSTAKDWDTKSLGTIGFGGYLHWHFLEDMPQLGFYSGLLFNQFGGRWEYSDVKEKDKISYLTIPITFTYEITDGLRVEVGPDISFMVATKWVYDEAGDKTTESFSDDAAKAQIGYNIAIAYTHEESGLGGFFRWNGGFTNPYSNDYIGDDDWKVHNGGFSFGIRYALNKIVQ